MKVAEVMETSKQVTEANKAKKDEELCARRLRRQWVEVSIWTDTMLTALETRVKSGKWFSLI